MNNLRWFFISLCLIFLASLGMWLCVVDDAFLRGPDAYYYALQAKYWALTGHVKIPDGSFIHRLIGIFYLSGISIEQAFRAWVIISVGIASLTVVILRLAAKTPPRFLDGILFCVLLVSPSILFAAIEFPKMMSAMMLIPLWFFPILRNERYWPYSIIIAMLSALLHPAVLPLAIVFSAALLILDLVKRRGRIGIFIAGSLLVLILAGGPLYIRSFAAGRLSGGSWTIGIVSLLGRPGLPPSFILELAITAALFVLIFINAYRKVTIDRGVIFIPLTLIIFAFLPLKGGEVMGVGERYALMTPYFLIIGSAYLHVLSPIGKPLIGRQKYLLIPLAAVALVASYFRPQYAHPIHLDPDYAKIDGAVRELSDENIPMLIAHKSFAYYYKYKFMKEAFPFEPESHWDKTRVWRILYGITPEELNTYLGERCKWGGGLLRSLSASDHSLIREDCWEDMRAKVSEEEDPELYGRIWKTDLNPSRRRPAFLYPKHREDDDKDFPALADPVSE